MTGNATTRLTLLAAGLLLLFAPTAPAGVFERDARPVPRGKIDELVFAGLKKAGIKPAGPCTDAVFLRRAYLDVIGTLPTAKEAADFLADTTPDKREKLVDRLLARDEFADYWAMKWCDVLRVKAEFPVNLWPNAVQSYHRWIHDSLRDNKPLDEFARELLTAGGSNFRVAPVNFYRASQSREAPALAALVALTFMGERFDHWPAERQAGMAAFFSKVGFKSTGEWKEEIVFFDPLKTSTNPAVAAAPRFPDGRRAKIDPAQDPRVVFADWLLDRDNPVFARAMANRAWAWLMGRGIVQEPDDFRPDNPPSNPELLAYLQKELVAGRYDLKHLFRLILTSQTYQLSCIPASDNPRAAALFAYYSPRRLEAEVMIDAICEITGTTEEYSSAIPEPFTFIPAATRSIALADGSITSPFLEMFGRPSRDTGLEAERNNRPTASQRLHLLNSSHIRRKLDNGPGLRGIVNVGARDPVEAVNQLYLTILSRYPTEEELKKIREYAGLTATGGGRGVRREAFLDLAWALVNSSEFLLRH